MTTITPFAAGSYLTTRNASQLQALKGQLNDLTNQLSSGQVSQTYGGLGSGRSTALSAQATLSALTGYAAGITAAQTRTNLAVTSLTQVATLGTSTGTMLQNGLQSVAANSVSGRSTALANLQTALDTLNESAAGNYLFGGSNTTTQPVVDSSKILDGTTDASGNKLDGLSTLISQRVTAELGAGGNGRLTQTPANPTTSVQITEETNDATRGKFGFTLAGAPTTTGTAIGATYAAGTATSPGNFTLSMTTQPSAGDTVSFALKMADGTSTTITLTAATSADPKSITSFAIGSTPAQTMANLSTTLSNALTGAANSTLAVNATAATASNFFSGAANGGPSGTGVMPQRIAYDGNKNPIGYTPATAQNTVLWYQGENSYDPATGKPTPAIDTQSVQVSATGSVGTGARANDPTVQNVLAGLATMAFGLPTTNDANTYNTYQTVATKAGSLLSSANQTPSVQDTVTQLTIASTRLSNAGTTNKALQNAVQNTLDGIEQISPEEVITKLLDVQNRLQASYQVTATLSKLSLVNYIS
ncbi:flagellin [Methylobacterium radiotolerans]|uniref:flagellin n=1 Tax=Methylobacterium radiotolerans TaxID=31998 RepID=UPI001F39AA3F|nr:flagellin [Methylobacterium radiotolerans]UIY42052.1 flagellin [Methylobacterium radiotolerans]